MSTRVATGVIGAGVGFVISGPQGAYYGWAIGSAVGNAIDPQIIRGPSIGDLAQQTSNEGGPIPIVFGMSAPMAGNVVATDAPRIVKKNKRGKGGPKVETETAYRTYAIGICEGPIGGVLRVWRNNTKVYDALDPEFSVETLGPGFLPETLPSRNDTFLENARFFLGTYDQNASPDLEAVFGAGTTPSYRGLAYMVLADEDLTDTRGMIPQWTFQVSATSPTVREVYAQFLSAGTYEPHDSVSTVDVLKLAGGGGGGAPGAGGGGAGGLVISNDVPVSGSVAVTVGAGGAGGTSAGTNEGSDGGNSTFGGSDSEPAEGGGGGAGPNSTGPSVGQGKSGGCGGGGARRLTNGNNPGGLGGSGTQGFAGGQGWQSASCGNSGYGGGGGGLGGVGQGGTNSGDKAGGPGISLASTGFGGAFMATHNIGGGGGGGACNGGNGGFGGGGAGSNSVGGGGAAGSSNTGGGGGGEVVIGNAGGSGLALVRERHVDAFRYTDVNPNVRAYLRVFDTIEDLTGNAAITRTGTALGNFVTARQRILTPTSFFNNGTSNNARYVTLRGSSTDYVFAGEFCVEGHFYYTGTIGGTSSVEQVLFSLGGHNGNYSEGGVTGLLRVIQNSTNQGLRLITGQSTVLVTTANGSLPVDAVNHVAVVRALVGGVLTLRLYINGVEFYSGSNSTTFGNTFVSGLSTIYIGRGTSSTSQRDWTGYWNRFKVTNGEPVYASAFTPPTTFNASGNDDIEGLPLSQAVLDICDRAGIDQSVVDLSQLPESQLLGLVVTNQYPASQVMLALGQVYKFDATKYDGKIRFIPRGGNSVATITENDLVDDDSELQEAKRSDAIQIPRTLHLSYHDADSDGLTPIKQSSDRSGDRRAVGELSMQSAVVMDADLAAQTVAIAHSVMIEEQKGELRFPLSDKHIGLVPSDPIIAQFDGRSERVRIHQLEIMDGYQQYACLRDRQSAVTSTVEGVPPPVIATPPSRVIGPTVLALLDIPILRDADDNAGLAYHVAVAGLTEAWAGATVELSYDGGANYVDSRESTISAVIGELLTALPDHPADYPDEVNSVSVYTYQPSDELLDSTLAGMLNRANLAAIGSPSAGWELVNFAGVEETTGAQQWTLSNLLRGRKGTATQNHPIGAQFVLLDRALLGFEAASVTDIGRTMTFRATSSGESVANGTVLSMVFAGKGQTERAPAYLSVVRDVNDLNVNWQGVGRLGGGAVAMHGAFFTNYRVTFDDGADQIVVDTLAQSITQDVSTLSSPVTVSVQQINSLTGAGPAIEVIVT